jgi:hypothetical protein
MGVIASDVRKPDAIPTGIEMDTAEFRRAPVFFPACNARSARERSGSPRTHGCATRGCQSAWEFMTFIDRL